MDDYKELIERLKEPEAHYPGNFDTPKRANAMLSCLCQEAADEIESLLTENERLKHNLSTTEQTMREYQELAATRLEEIAKYRDAPVVAYATTNEEGDLSMLFFDEDEAGKYSGDDEPIKLIVKPDENK